MFIEHRTYTIKPGLVGAYLDDYGKSGWAVHSEHAPCMGHYYTEAGALFRIVSMWRYESFEDRLARRAELNARADWRDVMGRIAPLVTDIQSNLLVPSPCWVAGDWYLALFDHIDQMSMDGFLAGLTEDCTVTFGNQPTVKGQLTQGHGSLDILARDDFKGRKQGNGDRQIEMRTLLRQIGWRKVDRDPLGRKGDRQGLKRRANPLLGLGHRLVGQAYQRE